MGIFIYLNKGRWCTMKVDKKSDKEGVAAKDDVEAAKKNRVEHSGYVGITHLWHNHAF